MDNSIRQRQAVEMIYNNHGFLSYHYKTSAQKSPLNPESPGLEWLRESIGIDFISTVDSVWCSPPDDGSALLLADLRGLKSLQLSCEHLSGRGVSVLRRLDQLQRLVLMDIGDEDGGWESLGQLRKLDDLILFGRLFGQNLTDGQFASLRKLSWLKHLYIGETQLNDEQMCDIGALTSLESLELYGCARQLKNNDLQPLRNLKNLERIYVYGPTRISVEGLNGLVRALPYLRDARLGAD